MKKSICLILSLLFLISWLCGCAKTPISQHIYQDVYVECFKDTNNITLLRTFREYQAYIDMISVGDVSEEMMNHLSSYDEAFFRTQMLVVFYREETSWNTKVSVTNVSYKDSELLVTLQSLIIGGSNDARRRDGIFIELPLNMDICSVDYEIKEKIEIK